MLSLGIGYFKYLAHCSLADFVLALGIHRYLDCFSQAEVLIC